MSMNALRQNLANADRVRLLRSMASAIHRYTVMARDPDNSDVKNAKIKNLIHYLAGHLMALLDENEEITGIRLDTMVELTMPLNQPFKDMIVAIVTE